MIINGALECGPSPANPTASYNRQNYYRKFAADFAVDIAGEKLGTFRFYSNISAKSKQNSKDNSACYSRI